MNTISPPNPLLLSMYQIGPKETTPAKPFLLSSSLSSSLPVPTEKEKDLASTKKRFSIPNLTLPRRKTVHRLRRRAPRRKPQQ